MITTGSIKCIELKELCEILDVPKVICELIIKYMKNIKITLNGIETEDSHEFFGGVNMHSRFYNLPISISVIANRFLKWDLFVMKGNINFKKISINEKGYLIVPIQFKNLKYVLIENEDAVRGFIWKLIDSNTNFTVYKNGKKLAYDDKITIREIINYFK